MYTNVVTKNARTLNCLLFLSMPYFDLMVSLMLSLFPLHMKVVEFCMCGSCFVVVWFFCKLVTD